MIFSNDKIQVQCYPRRKTANLNAETYARELGVDDESIAKIKGNVLFFMKEENDIVYVEEQDNDQELEEEEYLVN